MGSQPSLFGQDAALSGGLLVSVMWPPSLIFFDFNEAKVQKSLHFENIPYLFLDTLLPHPPQHCRLRREAEEQMGVKGGCRGHWGGGLWEMGEEAGAAGWSK